MAGGFRDRALHASRCTFRQGGGYLYRAGIWAYRPSTTSAQATHGPLFLATGEGNAALQRCEPGSGRTHAAIHLVREEPAAVLLREVDDLMHAGMVQQIACLRAASRVDSVHKSRRPDVRALHCVAAVHMLTMLSATRSR